MIETNERPAYVYGEILSQPVNASDEQPGFGTFLSQGAMVGALFGFFSIAIGMLAHPDNGYNFFLMFYLLPYVLSGMVLGAFEGSIIWICAYIARRRLHFVLRGFIGIAIHAGLMKLLALLMAEHGTDPKDVSATVYFLAISYYIVLGAAFTVVGSRFQPWYELFRGTTSTSSLRVETGLSGLALRVVVIFAFMESVLNFIWQQQRYGITSDYTISLIAVIHFIAAGVLVFARMRFWLLLQLALLVNFPVVLFMTDVLTTNDSGMRIVSIIYLSAWFVFLVTRSIDMQSSRDGSVST